MLAIRWTVGDVSDRGFEALRLSIRGAFSIYGDAARYAVCVNGMGPDEARRRTGGIPAEAGVDWVDVRGRLPALLLRHLDAGMAEGVGWKLAPLRLFPHDHELSLDNDCILWAEPAAVRAWRQCDDAVVLAEDVEACFGQFAGRCPPAPRNSGMRGLPPGLDLEAALYSELLPETVLRSELDEQGLQVAALSRGRNPWVVSRAEVSICSPFWPRQPELGSCGAHFVGLNARHLPWNYFDRPADVWMEEHWRRHRDAIAEQTGAPVLTR